MLISDVDIRGPPSRRCRRQRAGRGGTAAHREPLGEPHLAAAGDLRAELLRQHRFPHLSRRPLAEEALRVLGQHRLDEALQDERLELGKCIGRLACAAGARDRSRARRSRHRGPVLPVAGYRLRHRAGLPARQLAHGRREIGVRAAAYPPTRASAARPPRGTLPGRQRELHPSTMSDGGLIATVAVRNSPACRHYVAAILREACVVPPTSGADLTFATHLAAASRGECQIQSSTTEFLNSLRGPTILTFAGEAAAKRCEC